MQNNNITNSRKYVFRIWEDFANLRRVKPGLEDLAITFADGLVLSSYGFYYTDQVPQSSEVTILGPRLNRIGREVVTMVRPYAAAIRPGLLVPICGGTVGQYGGLKASPRDMSITDAEGRIIFSPHQDVVDDSEAILTIRLSLL